jgi:hypothetical protein
MSALRSRPAAPTAVARAPQPLAAAGPVPQPSGDLAAAAHALGAEVSAGPDFMEISFPPPSGAASAAVTRPPAEAVATVARTPAASGPAALPPAATAPRTLGNASTLARQTSGGGSGGSATDSVVDAVLKALREENEHLGIIDGIDPLF